MVGMIFFPEFNIRFNDKNSESIFFSATLGIRIFFWKKNIPPPFKLNGPSLTRDIWNYKRANYDLMKSKIKEVNWYELIYKTTEINTACTNFTDNFMGICKLCIPSQKIIIREDDKIWFDSNLRTAIRLRD